MPDVKLTYEVEKSPRAPALARRAVGALDLAPGLADDVRLLVSELVTNSVKYGGDGPIRLDALAGRAGVRIEVADGGAPRRPRLAPVGAERPGGWGLRLVEQLADRWGIEAAEARPTYVWFELGAEADLPEAASA